MDEPSDSTFAARIDRVLLELKWSQRQLAKETGLTTAAISRYRSGERPTPDAEAVDAIAKATNYGYEWLMFGRGAPRGGSVSLPEDAPVELLDVARDRAGTWQPGTAAALLALWTSSPTRERRTQAEWAALGDSIEREVRNADNAAKLRKLTENERTVTDDPTEKKAKRMPRAAGRT